MIIHIKPFLIIFEETEESKKRLPEGCRLYVDPCHKIHQPDGLAQTLFSTKSTTLNPMMMSDLVTSTDITFYFIFLQATNSVAPHMIWAIS